MFTTLEDVIELFKQPGQGLPHVLVEPISNIVNEMEHDSGLEHYYIEIHPDKSLGIMELIFYVESENTICPLYTLNLSAILKIQ